MFTLNYEPSQGFKSLWPAMWCEHASITIAEVLAARDLGQWTFVQRAKPNDMGGHAWLELRSADGNLIYCIDATVHQFGVYGSDPHFGPTLTPAAADFTRRNFEGPWRDWHVTRFKPQYAEWAELVVKHLGLHEQ